MQEWRRRATRGRMTADQTKGRDPLMYNNPAAPTAGAVAAGSGTLAMSGAGDVFWLLLAAFALLALGLAIKRIVPVRGLKDQSPD